MTALHKVERAAADVLMAHDELLASYAEEPDSDEAPDAWLLWRDNWNAPAYRSWSAAMDKFAAALGDPDTSRHPYNFRPLCEGILQEGR